MLTDTNIYGLIVLLKKLEARNLKWDYEYHCDCGVIEVFDRSFKFSRSGIKALARYINTYDEMVKRVDAGEYIFSDKVIEKHIKKMIDDSKREEVTKKYIEKKQQEETVDVTEECVEGNLYNKSPKGYNDMIKATLADLKEKCGLRDELMEKLFKVLEQDEIPEPPPPDTIDKGM
jgi:hypothetical protein